ncbi:MAG: hypothetical protein ACK4YP_19490 [Myxococcota bacterium]
MLQEADDYEQYEQTQEVYFLRVVPESSLGAPGASRPGPHLLLNGPAAANLDAWQIGAAWGWTRAELAAMQARGEHLVALPRRPGENWDIASADDLAARIVALRRAEIGNATRSQVLAAITSPPAVATVHGLGPLRERVAAVLDVPPGAFARLPRRGEPVDDLPFLLDDAEPTAPDEDAEVPALLRIPWSRG